MENKEKQIEKMTKVMQKCYEKNGLLNFRWFVESAYKCLTEDSVVLPKNEYAKLLTDMRRLVYKNCNLTIENKNLKEDLDIEVLKGKETAEKIITKIKQSLNSVETIVVDTHKLQPKIGYNVREVDNLLDELAKQFGVEIKE